MSTPIMFSKPRHRRRTSIILTSLLALSACSDGFDFDMRGLVNGDLSTAKAAQSVTTTARPSPDSRGVIAYPEYQVAVAKNGDTVNSVAKRIGMQPAELGRYNGLALDAKLRRGEVLALPHRVKEPTGGIIQPNDTIDIQTLASDAIDRSDNQASTQQSRTKIASNSISAAQIGSAEQPDKHRVKRGETAYSIARLHGVSVRSLAQWNGLGSDLSLREGQFLIIPVKVETPAPEQTTSQPGEGSTVITPPSAVTPLPQDEIIPEKITAPSSPALQTTRTSASAARMGLPVSGKVVSLFDPEKAGYILISAKDGDPVSASANGTVRLVSKDVEGEEIIVIDHGNGSQSAYSFIKDIMVSKGQKVKRGQQIAKASKNQYNAIQFLVFKGTEPVDPLPYLQ